MYHYGISLGMFGFVGLLRWEIRDDAKTKDALNECGRPGRLKQR